MHSSGGDFHIINGILQTAHSLFKRYRFEFKSQELWSEIKYVLDTFAKPFTDLFVATVQLTNTHVNNPKALKVIFSSLVLCAKIFYSLNSQDLPEFFEDNITIWMGHFVKLLTVDSKLLQTDDVDEASLVDQLKSQICDNVTMYAQKYHEEFQLFLPEFMSNVWNLLVHTGLETKYDILVSNAIRFLSAVADRLQFKHLFEEAGVLDSLCSKVIIPNMQFRESDEEMFHDNSEEYIRRDIEGSDLDTRRRAACDFVKSLRKFFEGPITSVFSQYVNNMLTFYAANPKENWKSKDVAVYLVTALSVKAITAREGTTKTSELVNLVDFYNNFVKQDLEGSNINELSVLRADALKYIIIFRNQLPFQEIILPSLPLIVAHLNAENVVVHSYAAHTIEKLFTLRDPLTNAPAIKVGYIQNLTSALIHGLFNIFSFSGSSENDYAMKAIMRTFSLLNENISPYFEEILKKLTAKLIEISKNPSKPHFNHYLFESLAICIKIGCKMNKEYTYHFEALLFPIFQDILVQDVQEFMPYVFQLLSLLLESRDLIVDTYMQLFPCLLAPILWDRNANIRPLVRLLRAYIDKGAAQIAQSGKIEPLLGVFQKLIASKTHDHEGFNLLQSIIKRFNLELISSYIKQIFMLLFHRLTSSKTLKFIKCLLVFFSYFAHQFGPTSLSSVIDEIQPMMFGMVLERLFVAEVQKVSGHNERVICAVGMTDILTQDVKVIEGCYNQYWPTLLQSLIALLEEPEDETLPEDEHFVDIEDSLSYQASYSHLIFAGNKETEAFDETIKDPKVYLAVELHKLSLKLVGRLPSMINAMTNPAMAAHLKNYLDAAKVTVS